MANKIALLLLGGIVVIATSAGAAIGVYLGDGGPVLGGGDADGGSSATLTPTATPVGSPTGGGTPTERPGSADSTPTPAATATPTGTATPRSETTATPIPGPIRPDSFNETKIRKLVVDMINDRRQERGLNELRPNDVLVRMATNHSDRMSEQGYLSHAAGGLTTEDRYRRNGMYDTCKVADDTNTGLRTGDELETLDKVSAGGAFDNRTNRNERQVAEDAVENWFSHDGSRRKLTYQNAGRLGVGVHISGSNRAYLTVDLCS